MIYTEKILTEQIQALGIKDTDLLTVHISLKAVGNINTAQKTGAEVFIDALKNSVPNGLLLVPSHIYSNIREIPVFDIKNTVTGIDYDGRRYERMARNCRGPAPAKYYVQYQPYLEKAGAISYGKIGDADVILCDAIKTFDTIVELRKNGFELAV